MNRMPKMHVPWSDGGGADYSSTYQDLAIAIVVLAVKDYKKTLRAMWKDPKSVATRKKLLGDKMELEEFFHSDDYLMYCDIDPDRLMRNCRVAAVEDEKKAIARRNKRKINEMKNNSKEEAYETGKNIS